MCDILIVYLLKTFFYLNSKFLERSHLPIYIQTRIFSVEVLHINSVADPGGGPGGPAPRPVKSGQKKMAVSFASHRPLNKFLDPLL